MANQFDVEPQRDSQMTPSSLVLLTKVHVNGTSITPAAGRNHLFLQVLASLQALAPRLSRSPGEISNAAAKDHIRSVPLHLPSANPLSFP